MRAVPGTMSVHVFDAEEWIGPLPVALARAAKAEQDAEDERRNYLRLAAHYGKAVRVIAARNADLERARASLRETGWWVGLAFVAGGCAVGFLPAALRAAAVLWRVV